MAQSERMKKMVQRVITTLTREMEKAYSAMDYAENQGDYAVAEAWGSLGDALQKDAKLWESYLTEQTP